MRAFAARAIAALALFLGVLASASAAQPGQPSAAARAFAAFLGQASPVCLREASRRCIDAGWRFADRDRDSRVTVEELETVRAELRDWLTWPDNGIKPAEKRGVLIGLMVVETLGLPRLVQSYDTDGDGALSRDELLSDIQLDNRPLGEILSDTSAVDWSSLRTRLGALAPALETLTPGTGPKPK